MGNVTQKLIVAIASGGGVGFSPFFPGTLGTLIAVPLSLGVNRIAEAGLAFGLLALAGLILIAISVADRAAKILGEKDPQVVVIDEIAGFAVANFLNSSVGAVVMAFVLFRIFDIAKVFPADRLEKMPGGDGIVLDDIMAGFYTLMILRILGLIGLG